MCFSLYGVSAECGGRIHAEDVHEPGTQKLSQRGWLWIPAPFSCHCLTSMALQMCLHHSWISMWVLGRQTSVFVLAWQALYQLSISPALKIYYLRVTTDINNGKISQLDRKIYCHGKEWKKWMKEGGGGKIEKEISTLATISWDISVLKHNSTPFKTTGSLSDL